MVTTAIPLRYDFESNRLRFQRNFTALRPFDDLHRGLRKQAVRATTQYAPARCTPDAAAQLQPIPYACGAQRALLPIAVDAKNINELMNTNDVRESAEIFPAPAS